MTTPELFILGYTISALIGFITGWLVRNEDFRPRRDRNGRFAAKRWFL